MLAIRERFSADVSNIIVPAQIQGTEFEVIFLPVINKTQKTDKNGWPIGFFEATYGSLPDLLASEPQDYDLREIIV